MGIDIKKYMMLFSLTPHIEVILISYQTSVDIFWSKCSS